MAVTMLLLLQGDLNAALSLCKDMLVLGCSKWHLALTLVSVCNY